ncbi:hypothetical protein [Streptomyces sp. NPDC127033]|uniref:hypothetical protein n=1 Tax=Streptomyces sp. NPDC127033 TaxID=3347110 RepID=UPI00365004C1
MSDGFAWLHDELHDPGFILQMVRGVGVGELAEMLGADPGIDVMEPEAFNRALRQSGYSVPDWARLGVHGGWAFAFHGGSDGFHTQRPDHVKHLWEGRTCLGVQDNGGDPPVVWAVVDGTLDWQYFWGEVHETIRTDHPLTRRMVAEIGLGTLDPDEDPEEEGLYIPPMKDVYRLVGEHYGVSLPRRRILDEGLAGVFTSPRVYASGEPNGRYGNLVFDDGAQEGRTPGG